MRKIDRLKREALEACRFRGHDMEKFTTHSFYKETVAISCCRRCDKQVVVDTHPTPNGIEIGGEAVALSCED